MQELWKLAVSPRHLVVFEAAARHQSFTRAAQELNVQQPSVSLAVRELETALGLRLFHREHRKVGLTAAGTRLATDVTRALEQILASARAVQQFGRGDHVTLNASSAFTNYWMMPRLGSLRQEHPDIDLRLQSSDREPDLEVENISLAVRRGTGDWADCAAALIAPERIYPVASPRVMGAAVNLATVANLLHERLIHLEEPIRERPSWGAWFRHWDVPTRTPGSGLRLNDYALVLQAAMAGEGFAFGWHHIVEKLIAQELLAGKPDWSWHTGAGFYLVWSKRKPLGRNAKTVRDWILAQTVQP